MASIFDIFSTQPAQQAASAQIAGLNQGYNAAVPAINAGNQALTTNYTAALQPYLQNYNTAQQGTTQLGNVLGLNGPVAGAQAQQTLAQTPGYQFAVQQGDNAVTAQNAASGTTGSGNEAIALSKMNQGLAAQNYNNYVSQLQPYLSALNAAAGGIANVDTGLGSALNQNQNTLGQLGWSLGTGTGNANANADLSAYNASANMWNAILAGGKLLAGGAGAAGGGGGGGLFGGLPSNGAGTQGMGGWGAATISDVRLKEDIAPVGELYDGTNVYRFKYKGDDVPRIGLMAQEVEQKNPDAVMTHPSGFKMVDMNAATEYASKLSRFLEAA